jgi:phenylpropionate dioxygenase-like ring-hydroxylating dioxygenase large terminal subunit
MTDQTGLNWHPTTPRKGPNYPFKCWWVAALSFEVGRDLLGRWLLDTSALLYRTEDGRAVAVDNRCTLRAAPLSLGCHKGDNVQCGYYGFTFAPGVACVDPPSMAPALQIAAVDFVDPDSGDVRGKFRVSHATTPIDQSNMHYFYVIGRDHGNSPDEMHGLLKGSEIGFAEDEEMMEAVQEMMSPDPRGASAPEISVKSDAPGIQARRIVERWMARETA